jgi:hypothetical protein
MAWNSLQSNKQFTAHYENTSDIPKGFWYLWLNTIQEAVDQFFQSKK